MIKSDRVIPSDTNIYITIISSFTKFDKHKQHTCRFLPSLKKENEIFKKFLILQKK